MEIKKGYRLTKGKWHDFGAISIYVDENGMITRATKNHGQLPAAVYAPCKDGGYDNIMPCTCAEFRKKGVVVL